MGGFYGWFCYTSILMVCVCVWNNAQEKKEEEKPSFFYVRSIDVPCVNRRAPCCYTYIL